MKGKKIAVASVLGLAALSQVAVFSIGVGNKSTKTASADDDGIRYSVEASTQGIEQVSVPGLSQTTKSQIESLITSIAVNENNNPEYNIIKYSVDDIYFENGEEAGCVIDFSVGDEIGYIIALNQDGVFNPQEVITGKHSPYYANDGKNIYLSFGNYLIKTDDGNEIYSNVYSDGPASLYSNKEFVPESKTYTYTSVNKYSGYEIDHNFKNYSFELGGDENNCANAAGVNLLNYWNKKFNNDILKTDLDANGDIEKNKAGYYMHLFYDYMNTNFIFEQWGGTTPENCISGFERLIKEKGYHPLSMDVTKYDTIKYYISNNVPILFTSRDYLFTLEKETLPSPTNPSGSGSFTIDYEHTSGLFNAHTFVGYGYTYYDITKSNGSTEQLQFINVATGWWYNAYFNFSESSIMKATAIIVSKC